MAKKKATQVFRINCGAGTHIYVIARHPKGACSVAKQCGVTLPNRPVISPVPADYKEQALNFEAD